MTSEMMYQKPKEFLEEGDPCPNIWMDGCGTMIFKQDPCTCGPSPAPCPSCERSWLECDYCDLTDDPNCPTGLNNGLRYDDVN